MLVEITHTTTFTYDSPVSELYVELRLTPVTDGAQHLLQHRYRSSPARPIRQYVDSFGTTVSYLNLLGPAERLEVSFESIAATLPTAHRGTALEDTHQHQTLLRAAAYDYLRPTPLTARVPALEPLLRELRGLRGAPTAELGLAASDLLFRTFRYDPRTTSASSPIDDILAHGGGVCQDFAHLMLALCRALGCPARYASGYVAAEGESPAATHAWVELLDPGVGWAGFDPTHNRRVEEGYVLLGVGRDFRDVAPNRGVYRGAVQEQLDVRVTLCPIPTSQLEARVRMLHPQPRIHVPTQRAPRRPAPGPPGQQLLYLQQQQQQQTPCSRSVYGALSG